MKNILISLSMLLALTACNNEWDDHYKPGEEAGVAGKDLTTAIASDSRLTLFAGMLQKTGYDEILRQSQNYTVFAPTNEALAGVDLSNLAAITALVRNHISRISASVGTDMKVSMLNSKYISLNQNIFGGKEIVTKNQICRNGLLQVVDGYIPVLDNIYEAIEHRPDFSLMRDFILGYEKHTFDPAASVKIGMNADGLPVYDSVWVVTNPLFSWGKINHEDSLYFMLVPTNAAYQAAYDRYAGYFNVYDEKTKALSDSLSDLYTGRAVYSDLIFRGNWEENLTPGDSLVSTTGNRFARQDIEQGKEGQPLEASNGKIYRMKELTQSPMGKFHIETGVEAENNDTRKVPSYTRASVKGINNEYYQYRDSVSGRFLFVESENPAEQPQVTFTVNTALSATYDIYCRVVPGYYEDTTHLVQTRLAFDVSYLDGNLQEKTLAPNEELGNITSMTQPSMILVKAGVTFPVAMAPVKVTVRTNVPNSETAKYERVMRIDRIVLVPVEK